MHQLLLLIVFFSTTMSLQVQAQNGDSFYRKNIQLHRHYSEVIHQQNAFTTSEKVTIEKLIGSWSFTTSWRPSDTQTYYRVEKIEDFGLTFEKGICKQYFIAKDSVRYMLWLWGVEKDTLFTAFAPEDLFGDTFLVKEQIISLHDDTIVLKQLDRDTLSSAVLCGIGPERIRFFEITLPKYTGDLQKNLEKEFEAYDPLEEYYQTTIFFYVNCKGELLQVYPYGEKDYGFERKVVGFLKKSGKWQPAYYNGINYDSRLKMDVEWYKGNISYRITDRKL